MYTDSTLVNVPSPAKLNLFLHVVGRRLDGYHELETVFQLIDLCDYLHFKRRDDGQILRAAGTSLDVDFKDDLCFKAARLLQEYAGCNQGVEIGLDKKIPMGGGLGGGSSNAATVLLALNRLWNLELNRDELARLALNLGADVPVFIGGDNAFATGVGEKLTPVQTKPMYFVVVQPPVFVSTPQIFSDPELTRDTKSVRIQDFLDHQNATDALGGLIGRHFEDKTLESNNQKGNNSEGNNLKDKNLKTELSDSRRVPLGYQLDLNTEINCAEINLFGKNDLESVVFKKFDVVRQIAVDMQALTKSKVRLTGSGACLFTCHQNKLDASSFLNQICDTIPTVKFATLAKGLCEHPLKHWVSD